MKHRLLLFSLFRPGAVFAAACLVCAGLAGEATPHSSGTQVKKDAYPHLSAYDLEIANGELVTGGKKQPATMGRIVNVLRELYPDSNIALAPELAQMQVGDLKLRSAQLPETLEALRVASGDGFVWQRGLTPQAIDPRTGLPVSSDPGSSSLYILTPNDDPAVTARKRQVEVFNLTGYLERSRKDPDKEISETLEQIQTIVRDTLLEVKGGTIGPGDPSFRFHRGANLLIVIGSPYTLEVARRVVNALPGVQPAQTLPPDRPPATPADEAFRRRYGLPAAPALPGPGAIPPPATPVRPDNR